MKNKTPLKCMAITFGAFIVPLFFFVTTTDTLVRVHGKFWVFITLPLIVLGLECYYRLRIELRKERGETKL